MPNTFAYAMLFIWPVAVFLAGRGPHLRQAILVARLGGFLLLPERVGIDISVLPTFDKSLAPILGALLLVAAASSGRRNGQPTLSETVAVRSGWLPQSKILLLLIAGLLLGAVATALVNDRPYDVAERVMPGLTLYDAMSTIQITVITLIPMLLGRKYFGDQEGQKLVLVALVVAGALYTILAVWEMRMSPQLHKDIYGFAQHEFRQHVRGDSYRPMIFLKHGLLVSLFLAMAFLSALALTRIRPAQALRYAGLAGYLFVVLVLTRSLGALALATLLAPLMLFGTVRLQILCAALVALLVLSYPASRANTGLLVDWVMSSAEKVSPDRAASFSTRLRNEELLLEKGMQKPLLGWGTRARPRIHDAKGNDITIADGFWIITFGQGGWLRYLSLFGLLTLPILMQALPRNRPTLDRISAALALIMALNLIDLIPNSGLMPVTWLIAGAMIGRLEQRAEQTDSTRIEAAPAPTAGPGGLVATTSLIRKPGIADTDRATSPPASARSPYSPVLRGSSGRNPHRIR